MDYCLVDVVNGILIFVEIMDLFGIGKFFKWIGEECEF